MSGSKANSRTLVKDRDLSTIIAESNGSYANGNGYSYSEVMAYNCQNEVRSDTVQACRENQTCYENSRWSSHETAVFYPLFSHLEQFPLQNWYLLNTCSTRPYLNQGLPPFDYNQIPLQSLEEDDFRGHSERWHTLLRGEIFSRKVFVGGIPMDVDRAMLVSTFSQFGGMTLMGLKETTEESKETQSSKRYCFVTYLEERSVKSLVRNSRQDAEGSYYIFVEADLTAGSGRKFKNKKSPKVHVRPWRLSDSQYYAEEEPPFDHSKTVYVYGVPRPTKAEQLAAEMENAFGKVCYAGLDLDFKEQYPLTRARVTFYDAKSYCRAIATHICNVRRKNKEVCSFCVVKKLSEIQMEILPYPQQRETQSVYKTRQRADKTSAGFTSNVNNCSS